MQSLSDDERRLVLGEVLADELKVIHKYVKDAPSLEHGIKAIKQDVSELKSDMKVVKAVVTDISRQQKDHEHRIARLEVA
jgi:uncharacterized membrane protein